MTMTMTMTMTMETMISKMPNEFAYETKVRKRAEAEERAAKYKRPEAPQGMREAVKRGELSPSVALDYISGTDKPESKTFRNWLMRRKKNERVPATTPKKRRRQKKKEQQVENE